MREPRFVGHWSRLRLLRTARRGTTSSPASNSLVLQTFLLVDWRQERLERRRILLFESLDSWKLGRATIELGTVRRHNLHQDLRQIDLDEVADEVTVQAVAVGDAC